MPARILIVDDNRDILEMWVIFFNLEGFQVITAIDGRDGYQKAEREHPDIIVTDINMPRLNGVRMIQKLRAHPTLSVIPIIAVTAQTMRQVETIKKAGADLILQKPVEASLLVDSIKQLLESSRKFG